MQHILEEATGNIEPILTINQLSTSFECIFRRDWGEKQQLRYQNFDPTNRLLHNYATCLTILTFPNRLNFIKQRQI